MASKTVHYEHIGKARTSWNVVYSGGRPTDATIIAEIIANGNLHHENGNVQLAYGDCKEVAEVVINESMACGRIRIVPT